jgi:fructokinase
MILVCGEALIDVFVAAGDGPELPAILVAGGSPFNVALGLARLGRPVAYCGGLSADRFGTLLRGVLAVDGVDLRWAVTKPQPTTLSVVAQGADGQPHYSFYGDNGADRSLTIADLPASLPDTVTAIAMGSYSLAVGTTGLALAHLAAREHAKRVISVDLNLRPALVGPLDAWRQRFAGFVRTASIVKASDEDVVLAYGAGTDLTACAAAWRADGAALAVITRGAAGAIAYLDGTTVEVPGHSVAVVDTVGAGDGFHAALLAGLDRRGMLTPQGVRTLSPDIARAVMAEAVAASALACTRRGADLPRAAEVAAFMAGADQPSPGQAGSG